MNIEDIDITPYDSTSLQDIVQSLCGQHFPEFAQGDLEKLRKTIEILENMPQRELLNVDFIADSNETQEYVFSNDTPNSQSKISSCSINWNSLICEFEAFRTITPEELSDGIEYLPSRYVAILDTLERNYTGEELTTQRERLEQIYQTGKSGMIDNYTKFLQANLGISNDDAQQIKDSFSVILNEKVTFYRDIVKQIPEIIAQTDPDDIRLQNQDTYIAEQLRAKATETINQTQSDAAYSVQDLTIVGQIAKQYQTEIDNVSNAKKTEATFELSLSMIDMQTEIMIQQREVSENMAKLLQSNRVDRYKAALYALNQALTKQEKDKPKDVNHSVFEEICSSIMKNYQTNEDGDAKNL